MNYEQALEYLQELDTTLFRDPQLTEVLHKAEQALRYCLELGLTGEDQAGAIRWEKAGEIHVQFDPNRP